MSTYDDDLAWLGGWEGYRVGSVEREGGERPRIWISLTPAAFEEMICEGCGGRVRALHDIVYRQVRDLPILDAATWLVVPRRRVACPNRAGGALMQTSGRQWALALTAAVLVHGGLAVAVLWQAPPSGAISASTGGIEIALGPAGGAPGASAQPVEHFAEASPVDAIETVQSEMPAQAARTVPIERVEAESVPAESAERKAAPEPTVAESVVAEPLKSEAATPPASPPPTSSPPTPEKTPERATAAAVAPPPAGADGKAGAEASSDAGSADDASGGGLPGATADYMALLQAWLEKHKEYPRQAQMRRQEGTVLLSFIMDRNGRVLEYRIARTSGHALLDREVEAMIARAQPLPKMPDDMRKARLELIVPVQFFLR